MKLLLPENMRGLVDVEFSSRVSKQMMAWHTANGRFLGANTIPPSVMEEIKPTPDSTRMEFGDGPDKPPTKVVEK